MSKVAIVTDSTAYLPDDYLNNYNIKTVPLALIWGQETFEDGVDIQPDAFYQKLSGAKIMPTTSQVSIVNMHKAFNTLIEQDYEVLGIFISSKLSGTDQSAVQGRELLAKGKEKVQIFDSQTTAMALGFQALAAARAAQNGATMEECIEVAKRARDNSGVYFVVDTLEFLHRGGRIGGAQRLLGTALNLKPILTIKDGKVDSVEKIRTKSKAIDRLIEIIGEKTAGKDNIRRGLLQGNAHKEGREALDKASSTIKPVESIFTSVSPVIGAHTGPGTLGLAYVSGS